MLTLGAAYLELCIFGDGISVMQQQQQQQQQQRQKQQTTVVPCLSANSGQHDIPEANTFQGLHFLPLLPACEGRPTSS